MRPDDRLPPVYEGAPTELDLAFDAGLESLDAELAAAGSRARRALEGRTQPTRVYSVELRAWLLARLGPSVTTDPERRFS